MNRTELAQKGYKKFDDKLYKSLESWQKKVKDETGVKYFITFLVYNHYQQIGHGPNEDRWEVKLQFSLPISTMNITLFSFNKNKSIDDIETYIDDLFILLGAEYYEEY